MKTGSRLRMKFAWNGKGSGVGGGRPFWAVLTPMLLVIGGLVLGVAARRFETSARADCDSPMYTGEFREARTVPPTDADPEAFWMPNLRLTPATPVVSLSRDDGRDEIEFDLEEAD